MQQKKLFGEAGFEFDGSVNFPENIEKMIDSAIEGLRSSGHEAELNCCNKLKNVIEEYKAQVRTAVVKKADKTTCLKQVSEHKQVSKNKSSSSNRQDVSEPDYKSKIGEFVRNAVEYLISNNYIDEELLKNITSAQWCRKVLHLNHPFFKEIDEKKSLLEQRRDEKGRARYWDILFSVGSKKYVVCKEWFERQRQYFVPWYEKIINNAKSEAIYKKNRPIGLRNLF